MKKISHEVPVSLLEQSRQWNDYDYALVHLFEKYPQYFEFFKESLKIGREVILDNSIFELGTAFDSCKFAEIILDLKPTYYIIPDVLEDCDGTIENLLNWIDLYKGIPGKKIGVVQGKTYDEIVRCYEVVNRHCDKIAISFDYSLYESLVPMKDRLVSWMYGRQKLLLKLLTDSVINFRKQHHLLGCSLPREFRMYKSTTYNFITSIDTSNPIVHGIYKIRYDDQGLNIKRSIKMCDLMESVISTEQFESILHNVHMFKQFVNG